MKEALESTQLLHLKKARCILEAKLNKKFQGETNNFIGLLCIYIYLANADKKAESSKLGKSFSLNLTNALTSTYKGLKENEGTDKEKPSLVSMSTLLFIIVSFIQKIE